MRSGPHGFGVSACVALAGFVAGSVAFLGEVRSPVPVVLGAFVLVCACGYVPAARRALQGMLVVVSVGLLVVLCTPVLRPALTALEERNAPTRADAIVILGGGIHCGSGDLGADSAARLQRGLALWQAGFAGTITVSEQADGLGAGACPLVSERSERLARALFGEDGPDVRVLRNVRDTRDEAERVRALARALGWRRVLLVTSPSHSRRAATLLRERGVAVTSVPAEEPRYDVSLRLPSDRLSALRVLLYEWFSRAKAALRGG